eukprot:1823191-Rhodomonas_salina.1
MRTTGSATCLPPGASPAQARYQRMRNPRNSGACAIRAVREHAQVVVRVWYRRVRCSLPARLQLTGPSDPRSVYPSWLLGSSDAPVRFLVSLSLSGFAFLTKPFFALPPSYPPSLLPSLPSPLPREQDPEYPCRWKKGDVIGMAVDLAGAKQSIHIS